MHEVLRNLSRLTGTGFTLDHDNLILPELGIERFQKLPHWQLLPGLAQIKIPLGERETIQRIH